MPRFQSKRSARYPARTKRNSPPSREPGSAYPSNAAAAPRKGWSNWRNKILNSISTRSSAICSPTAMPLCARHGIEGLWEDEDAALVKPFAAFLRDDPDAGVRAAAADALGRLLLLAEYGRLANGQAETIGEALLAATRNLGEDLAVRCRAVEALGYWSDDVVREVITAAYDDAAPEMRASAVAAMGRSADKYWRETAANELQSPDARMRFEAARATGELENRDATPALIELLDDPDREVQSAAITALGQVGGKLAKRALTEAAASDDEMLSTLADEALQELEFGDNAEFLLFDMTTEEDESIVKSST